MARRTTADPPAPKRKTWLGEVEAHLEAVQQRRRDRVMKLLASFKSQTEAIKRLNAKIGSDDDLAKGQALVSQLSSGKKVIGEALARDLEYRLGLPFNSLDEGDDTDVVPMPVKDDSPEFFCILQEEFDNLDESDQKIVESSIAIIKELVKKDVERPPSFKPARKSGR